jgi:hypothetical protein
MRLALFLPLFLVGCATLQESPAEYPLIVTQGQTFLFKVRGPQFGEGQTIVGDKRPKNRVGKLTWVEECGCYTSELKLNIAGESRTLDIARDLTTDPVEWVGSFPIKVQPKDPPAPQPTKAKKKRKY